MKVKALLSSFPPYFLSERTFSCVYNRIDWREGTEVRPLTSQREYWRSASVVPECWWRFFVVLLGQHRSRFLAVCRDPLWLWLHDLYGVWSNAQTLRLSVVSRGENSGGDKLNRRWWLNFERNPPAGGSCRRTIGQKQCCVVAKIEMTLLDGPLGFITFTIHGWHYRSAPNHVILSHHPHDWRVAIVLMIMASALAWWASLRSSLQPKTEGDVVEQRRVSRKCSAERICD